MAAAIGEDDTPNLHFADTLQASAGLADPEAVSVLVDGGRAGVDDLIGYGVEFDRAEDGSIKLGREAAHCRDRIVHATGDQAGAAIMAALIETAQKSDHITIRERLIAEDLLLTANGEIGGALIYDVAAEERMTLPARHTVLATGGLGGLYAVTTNPVRARGHGLAFAARAGALIRDPEFVQFHPTAIDVAVDPAPLATEALRGDGALLVNRDNRRFMEDYHQALELAPRDIVARAVEAEKKSGRGAFLDARESIGARFPDAYPTVFAACQAANINPITDLIPIAPAAHYHMGGVATDLDGQTSLEGLSAVGEVASTGVHGANRLASNSLLEAVVFGARIAENLRASELPELGETFVPEDRLEVPPKPAPADKITRLRAAMSDHAALIRDEEGLGKALELVDEISSGDDITSGLKSDLVSAELVLQGALSRTESRGSHYRSDFPEKDDEAFHTELCTVEDDEIDD